MRKRELIISSLQWGLKYNRAYTIHSYITINYEVEKTYELICNVAALTTMQFLSLKGLSRKITEQTLHIKNYHRQTILHHSLCASKS